MTTIEDATPPPAPADEPHLEAAGVSAGRGGGAGVRVAPGLATRKGGDKRATQPGESAMRTGAATGGPGQYTLNRGGRT